MNQSIEKIESQADPDDQANDGLGHLRVSLQAIASGGVETHQNENQDSDDDVDNVGHGEAPPNFTARSCAFAA